MAGPITAVRHAVTVVAMRTRRANAIPWASGAVLAALRFAHRIAAIRRGHAPNTGETRRGRTISRTRAAILATGRVTCAVAAQRMTQTVGSTELKARIPARAIRTSEAVLAALRLAEPVHAVAVAQAVRTTGEARHTSAILRAGIAILTGWIASSIPAVRRTHKRRRVARAAGSAPAVTWTVEAILAGWIA